MANLNLDFPEHVQFSLVQTVRIQDVNYRKHVGHDNIISMIHHARAAFFDSIGLSELVNSSQGYILADLQVRYLDEAFFGEQLTFEIAVSDVSKRSCQMHYQITKMCRQTGTVKTITKATTAVVFYDYDLKQAIPVPNCIKTLLTHEAPEDSLEANPSD